MDCRLEAPTSPYPPFPNPPSRGRKRFRLFDPSQAPSMYTQGVVRFIHPNGRIVYEGQGDVLPDGTDARDVALWRERTAAEADLARAELSLSKGQQVRLLISAGFCQGRGSGR